MAKAKPVLLSVCLLAGALLGGCGSPTPEPVQNEGDEVTIVLPPAEPVEMAESRPAPSPQPPPPADTVEVPLPAPAAPAETEEQSPPPAEAGLVEAPPPLAMPSLGRYIRGAGFACDEVVASRQLERDGDRVGIYRFDCGSGEAYQGTMRQNHLYFREWRGIPAG